MRAVTHHAREQAQEIIISEKPKQFMAPIKDESKWSGVRETEHPQIIGAVTVSFKY